MSDALLTSLSADTSPSGDDITYTVNDPGGTPSDRKVTLADLLKLHLAAPAGRLTLTTGTPFLATSVTAATTIYYTPAVGSYLPIYDGTRFVPYAFTELSQTTTDNTKSPAAVANNSNYDLFAWVDSGTLRCTRGPLWTSDTARGTGAGTTELTFLNGLLVNANAITNGPVANKGTYVGSVRSNGSAQIDMIFGGAGGAGGEGTILGIWNMYNRRFAALTNYDTTDSWNYTTATFRLKNESASAELNKIKFICGFRGDGLSALNSVVSFNTANNNGMVCTIGLNSTSARAAGASVSRAFSNPAGSAQGHNSSYSGVAPLGFNYVAPLEYSTAGGTTTWFGDNGGGDIGHSVFHAQMMF